MKNPQLAEDWQPVKLEAMFKQGHQFILQPKTDGLRGLHQRADLGFTARSLKPFDNKANTRYYSDPIYLGIDGECVSPHVKINDDALCRKTTSILNTIEEPTIVNWVAFDLVLPNTIELPYRRRLHMLAKELERIGDPHLRLVKFEIAKCMDDVLAFDARMRELNMEGTIIRRADLPWKAGRSTQYGELWRIKPWIDFEVEIIGFVEAMQNNNEAKKNALGHTERSTHKANKTGKGMIGMIQGRVLKDVQWAGKVLFKAGMVIDIGPGELTHAERAHYFNNPKLFVGKQATVKVMPYGTKDKPRMPTFKALRKKGT